MLKNIFSIQKRFRSFNFKSNSLKNYNKNSNLIPLGTKRTESREESAQIGRELDRRFPKSSDKVGF